MTVHPTEHRACANALGPLRTSPKPQSRVKVGRPRVTDRPAFRERFGRILESLNGESISKRQATLRLGIGHATLLRLLEEVGRSDLVKREPNKSG